MFGSLEPLSIYWLLLLKLNTKANKMETLSILATPVIVGGGIIGIILCVFFPQTLGYGSFMPDDNDPNKESWKDLM